MSASAQAKAVNGVLSPTLPSSNVDASPRSSLDNLGGDRTVQELEQELATLKQEKDVLGNQYRSLLGKLTAMRTSLGDKLREDAEELDRRENTINTLQTDNGALQETIDTLKSELVSSSSEAASLQGQLSQLRSQSDSSSSDVMSLNRELRELRGEMERLRIEREEWEVEAGRERAKREEMEEDVRVYERMANESKVDLQRYRDEAEGEKERSRNLQDVLSEFQAAKDSEMRQATSELETQLRLAAQSLSEYKLRAANAETRLGEYTNDARKSSTVEKELKEKNQLIGKLRHDAVITNEHLTEALRRLRKNSSDNNVDRRLVTNILISFLTTPRADPKRFEMLALLSTILSWDDHERERAGLQRGGPSGTPRKGLGNRKSSYAQGTPERSPEDQAVINESFGNLFVEFLLKESAQGKSTSTTPTDPRRPSAGASPATLAASIAGSPPLSRSGSHADGSRSRAMSNSSSTSSFVLPSIGASAEALHSPETPPAMGRKSSWGLKQALDGMDRS